MHRLDQRVSGALLVARSADAAAWLSVCFARKAEEGHEQHADPNSSSSSSSSGRRSGGAAAARKPQQQRGRQRRLPGRQGEGEEDGMRGFFVRRVYWALVQGALRPGQSGRLRSMMHSEGAYPKLGVTDYRCAAGRGCPGGVCARVRVFVGGGGCRRKWYACLLAAWGANPSWISRRCAVATPPPCLQRGCQRGGRELD